MRRRSLELIPALAQRQVQWAEPGIMRTSQNAPACWMDRDSLWAQDARPGERVRAVEVGRVLAEIALFGARSVSETRRPHACGAFRVTTTRRTLLRTALGEIVDPD